MTACAFDAALAAGATGAQGTAHRRRAAFTIAADGSYGARLALSGEAGCWFPERWTLDGPEPYAVPLPAAQPEEPDSEVLPLADGQVLIRRRVAGRHALSLLYPAGPGTGERPLGAIECAELSLLPPAPGGSFAFALGHGERSTSVWLVHGGGFGPQHLAELPGRCTGGVWLDRTGRLLALDRRLDGRTKTVVVDLRRGGETSPLLQITDDSDDRLLLADPDSGLLLVRSDAPGDERLGWGVLGSARPVRFPDCLRPAQVEAVPFAVQPGQVLTPEACAVAFRVFRVDGPAERPWVGLWRPSERRLQQLPAPEGWLAGAGLWTRDGELRLPYATGQVPCGLARLRMPEPPEPPRMARVARVTRVDRVVESLDLPRPMGLVGPGRRPSAASSSPSSSPSLSAGAAIASWTRVGAAAPAVPAAPAGKTGVEPWAGTGSWAGVEQETGPEAEPGAEAGPGPEAAREPRRGGGGPGSGPPSGAERGRERVRQREREHVRVPEQGLVREQGGSVGRGREEGAERLPERLPAHRLRPELMPGPGPGPGPETAAGPESGIAARPVPLQQAPLARGDQLRPSHPSHQPRPPRPPRWVRDRRSG
ncbi:hypothetical protein B7755_011910 [Streptomyces sp. NBS 14/10]|uniref:hypothetical protein n=1 Tax=Streptomyces sp. NBS 14/10 TaxID=1945643 RepID=UPI00211B6C70|nr:hypothetical protein [Streptomyces sp. NBS 14/10]KAK1178781.1 hypothetical protein B7755_011910 [Streptomyces sp. NBS 14/10]